MKCTITTNLELIIIATFLTSMSASLDANDESCDREEEELEPGYMLFRLPTEEAELSRV